MESSISFFFFFFGLRNVLGLVKQECQNLMRVIFSYMRACVVIPPSLLWSQGIGTSAQGFANAILFCAFTKVVRQKLLGVVRCRFRKKRPCVCLHSTSSHAPPLEESTNYREDTSDDTPGLLINADTSEEPLLYHSTSGSSHPYTCTYNSITRSWPNGTVN